MQTGFDGSACDACKVKKEGLMRCARCKKFYYCSEKCQKADWKAGHKGSCVAA